MTSLFLHFNHNYLMINGKKLKQEIKKAGLTQQEAADKLGKSRATVITWTGKAEIEPEILELVKNRLGIDLTYEKATGINFEKDDKGQKEIQLLNEIITDLRERVEELKDDKARLQSRLDILEGKTKTRSA